jgi:hypothetical protein
LHASTLGLGRGHSALHLAQSFPQQIEIWRAHHLEELAAIRGN